MTIANKPGVRPYSPFLPFPAIFDKSTEFRDFLLTKRTQCNVQQTYHSLVINGQRGAMYSNEFKGMMPMVHDTDDCHQQK